MISGIGPEIAGLGAIPLLSSARESRPALLFRLLAIGQDIDIHIV